MSKPDHIDRLKIALEFDEIEWRLRQPVTADDTPIDAFEKHVFQAANLIDALDARWLSIIEGLVEDLLRQIQEKMAEGAP